MLLHKKYFFPNEQALIQFAAAIAQVSEAGTIIFLQGQLGAGKTTFTRGFLKGLGYKGIVKSPTYTLVETYQFNKTPVHHFDLYRLEHSEELEHFGLRDYLTKKSICLIEWPEKAFEGLPEPTLYCTIEVPLKGDGRWLELSAKDKKGIELINFISMR